jgi:hypothetical protein
MTYRERREARAERLTEWAGKREQRAAAAFETAHERASHIPFGQPILVGHHSEGRDRRYRAGIANQMDRGVEHQRKAASMASRAATIEGQLATSIYSDDEDAVPRLRERIAKLEADRDAAKALNAAYRKAHKTELAAMSPYQRNHAMPYPSYHFQNLSGNIGRQRKRLAQLEAQAS